MMGVRFPPPALILKPLFGAIEQAIQQAQVAKEGIQEPLLLTQYQTAISRHLYDALERLEAMKERKNQDSMGSFGETMELPE